MTDGKQDLQNCVLKCIKSRIIFSSMIDVMTKIIANNHFTA